MKRRTLIRNIGAAGIATAALSGPTAAGPSIRDLDREFDVASVEGEVTLEELLEPEELASLPAGIDASERITVASEAVTITGHECCGTCCTHELRACPCSCCVCDDEACT